MSIPKFELFSDRQIQKALDYAHSLFKVTPSLIILLILWGLFLIAAAATAKKSSCHNKRRPRNSGRVEGNPDSDRLEEVTDKVRPEEISDSGQLRNFCRIGRAVRFRRIGGCVLYFLTILQFCVWNREKSESSQIVLASPKWVEYGWFHETRVIETVLNLCIFVPLGILLYAAVRSARKRATAVVAGALCVELMQYFLRRGTFELIDLAMYSLGGMLGILMAWALARAAAWVRRKEYLQ